jgi:hypothetical protein
VYISYLPSEGNTIGSPVNQSIKHLFFFNAIISIDGSFHQSIMHLLSSMLPSQLTFLSPSEHGENWWLSSSFFLLIENLVESSNNAIREGVFL